MALISSRAIHPQSPFTIQSTERYSDKTSFFSRSGLCQGVWLPKRAYMSTEAKRTHNKSLPRVAIKATKGGLMCHLINLRSVIQPRTPFGQAIYRLWNII